MNGKDTDKKSPIINCTCGMCRCDECGCLPCKCKEIAENE